MTSRENFVSLRTWLLADLVRRVTRGCHVLQEQAGEPKERGVWPAGIAAAVVWAAGLPDWRGCELAAVPVGGGYFRVMWALLCVRNFACNSRGMCLREAS